MGDRKTDRIQELREKLAALHTERVERLRNRIKDAATSNPEDPLPGILHGMLDLLEDV